MKNILLSCLLLFGVYTSIQAKNSATAPEGYQPKSSQSISHAKTIIGDNVVKETKQILMIQDNLPWDSNANTVSMDELGYGYDVKKWSEVDIDVFRQYPIVLIVNDQGQQFYDDYATHKDEIEQWIQEGGALMFFSASDGWAGGTLNANLPGDVEYKHGYDNTNVVIPGTDYIEFTKLLDENMVSTYCSHGFYNTQAELNENLNIYDAKVFILSDDFNAPTVISYKMGDGYVFASTLTWEFTWDRFDASRFGRKALAKTFEYVINHGEAHKIPPKVFLSANTYSGAAPLTVDFRANASDTDGYIVQYMWDFDGDGIVDEITTSNNTTHTFEISGDFVTKVTVVDNDGLNGFSEVNIYVRDDLPVVTVTTKVHCIGIENKCVVQFTLAVDENYNEIFDWDFNNDGQIDQSTQGAGTVTYEYPHNTGSQIYLVKYEGSIVFRGIVVLKNMFSDFNADGYSDILFQRKDNARHLIRFMNGEGRISDKLIGGVAMAVKATGDLDGDGVEDILWQRSNARHVIWYMNSDGTVKLAKLIGGAAFTVMGVGDADGDGIADILWKSGESNYLVWLMNADGKKTEINFGTVAMTYKGIGDFNGDGRADILWQRANGRHVMWFLEGDTAVAVLIGAATMTYKEIGDFNGDGKSDILWQRPNNRHAIWYMNATGMMSAQLIGAIAFTSQAIGDYNGDGTDDILWSNSSNNHFIWTMGAGGKTGQIDVGSPNFDVRP